MTTSDILDRWVYGTHSDQCEAAGFVLQIYHPGGLKAFPGIRENPSWENIWELLEKMSDLRVIHLRRENGLARHLSHVLARRSGHWHQWNPQRLDKVTHLHIPDPPQEIGLERPVISLDADRLRQDFEEVDELHRAVQDKFSTGHYFPLSYEQLCREPEPLGESLLRFLNLSPAALIPAVSKLELLPLDQRISNFRELARAFKNTRWSEYFEPDRA